MPSPAPRKPPDSAAHGQSTADSSGLRGENSAWRSDALYGAPCHTRGGRRQRDNAAGQWHCSCTVWDQPCVNCQSFTSPPIPRPGRSLSVSPSAFASIVWIVGRSRSSPKTRRISIGDAVRASAMVGSVDASSHQPETIAFAHVNRAELAARPSLLVSVMSSRAGGVDHADDPTMAQRFASATGWRPSRMACVKLSKVPAPRRLVDRWARRLGVAPEPVKAAPPSFEGMVEESARRRSRGRWLCRDHAEPPSPARPHHSRITLW